MNTTLIISQIVSIVILAIFAVALGFLIRANVRLGFENDNLHFDLERADGERDVLEAALKSSRTQAGTLVDRISDLTTEIETYEKRNEAVVTMLMLELESRATTPFLQEVGDISITYEEAGS